MTYECFLKINKDLLDSTGNHICYLVITYNGKESEKEYVYMCNLITLRYLTLTWYCKLTILQFLKSFELSLKIFVMNNLSLLVTFIFKHLVNKVLLLLLINYYWLKNNEIFTLFTPQKNSQYFKILLQKSSTTYTHRMSTWNGGLSVFCESFRKYLLLSLLCRSARVLLGHLDLVTLHYYRQLSSSTSFAAGVVQSLNHVSLQPQELLHAKLPFPPLSPRVCSNSCPLSQWCYPTISSSVVPFSSYPQSFPASEPIHLSVKWE